MPSGLETIGRENDAYLHQVAGPLNEVYQLRQQLEKLQKRTNQQRFHLETVRDDYTAQLGARLTRDLTDHVFQRRRLQQYIQ